MFTENPQFKENRKFATAVLARLRKRRKDRKGQPDCHFDPSAMQHKFREKSFLDPSRSLG